MPLSDNILRALLVLIRAGLWETDARLRPYGKIDFKAVYKLAEEQSVIGLVAAGLEHVVDTTVPKEDSLLYAGTVLTLEHRNSAMNSFIRVLVERMRATGVLSLLIKGQGVAQCYNRPLWRAAGDVDLLLDSENYERAKDVFFQMAEHVEEEDPVALHQALRISGFVVELHGRMPFVLSRRVDEVIDSVLDDALHRGGVRAVQIDGEEVFLPGPDNHVFIVFTHFLHHYFIEGVGLRQICDWSRMLWTYRDVLDIALLERRLKDAGLMSEWKVFASMAVNELGMPRDVMPFYDADSGYGRKAQHALEHVLGCGNMGHNRDSSYRLKHSPFVTNVITFFVRLGDFAKQTAVFPVDAPRFFARYVYMRVRGGIG